MRLKYISIVLMGMLQGVAWAQVGEHIRVEQFRDPRFETTLEPIQKIAPTQIGEPSLPIENNDQETVHNVSTQLMVDDLKANFELTEQLLNQAMMQRNWVLAANLLGVYETFNQKDQILVLYVQGAIWRQQGLHKQAIQAYRNIVAAKPDLIYARFDLAIMLFENKEYEAAMDQFRKVQAGNIKPQFKNIADQYIANIQKQKKWNTNFSLQYTQNNNVNNASAIKEFSIANGAKFVKDEDSLPKSATGMRYGLSIDRAWNIFDNHYATMNVNLDGVEYWDNPDFNEITARIGAGYKYQNINSWLGLAPYVERNWFAGRPYMDSMGVTAQYGKWLNRQWQVSVASSLARKMYVQKGMESYDGHLIAGSLGFVYLYSPTLIFTSGFDYQRDSVKSEDNSYHRYGVRLGVIKEFEKGISTRLDLRYGHKKYDQESFLAKIMALNNTRKDDEYRAALTIWHRALRFYNITPKLTLGYYKVDSNLPMYYSRKNKEAYVVFEKSF